MNLKFLARWWPARAAAPAVGVSPAAATAPSQGAGLLAELSQRLGRAAPAAAPSVPGWAVPDPAAGAPTPSAGSAPARAPALPAARALPALRGAGQWLAAASLLVVAGLVVWLAVAAWGLVSGAHGLASLRLNTPTLGQFPALARTALLPANRLSPDLQRVLAPNEDRLLRAVQNIAMFENARAESVLRATPAVVQAVVEGSAAARAQVQAGDTVKRVNSKEAGFVWDVYKLFTERPVRLVELGVQRGAESLTLSLSLKDGERFDMANHGLLFAVPDTIRYIGVTDAERLTEQLRTGYVDALPTEWQRSYVEGLLGVSNELVSNLSTLNAAAYAASNYLRSEELLGWYHGRFTENLSNYRVSVERLRARQTEALLQLGWSLLALSAAGLIGLGLALKSTWALR